jgi:hypothetical protein
LRPSEAFRSGLRDLGYTDGNVHEVEAAGMKTLVAGQLLTYNTAPARDGRLKTVNPIALTAVPHPRRQRRVPLSHTVRERRSHPLRWRPRP